MIRDNFKLNSYLVITILLLILERKKSAIELAFLRVEGLFIFNDQFKEIIEVIDQPSSIYNKLGERGSLYCFRNIYSVIQGFI